MSDLTVEWGGHSPAGVDIALPPRGGKPDPVEVARVAGGAIPAPASDDAPSAGWGVWWGRSDDATAQASFEITS